MKPSHSAHRAVAPIAVCLAALAAGCPTTVGISRDDASLDAAPEPDAASAVDAVTPRPDVVAPPPDAVPARDVTRVDAPDVDEPLATIPARPSSLPDVPGAGAPVVFVARRIDFGFGSRDLWGRHGFDRDGIFTDPARPGHEAVACRPRGTTPPQQDGFEGRDNSFGANLGGPLGGAGWTESGTNESIANGTASFAFRVTDFGANDDGRVLVEWLPVIHGHRPGDPVSRPAFDGLDVWHVNARIASQIRSTSAFVSAGRLVMDFTSRAPLRLPGARYPARYTLSAGKVVGALTRSAEGVAALGPVEVSAIWPLADALNDLTTVGICPRDTLTYTFVTGALQGAADILGTLETGPMIECDAISVGFGMDFVPASLGPDEQDAPYNEDLCAGP